MTNQKSNYEIQTQKALILFPKWNHEKIAKKFNLELDEHYLYINFIGQKYRLNRQSVYWDHLPEIHLFFL